MTTIVEIYNVEIILHNIFCSQYNSGNKTAAEVRFNSFSILHKLGESLRYDKKKNFNI